MHRNGLEYITQWHRKKGRKPLIIRGARQVGKSYLVREFVRRAGLTLLEINFEKNPEAADLFDQRSIAKTCEFLELQYKIRLTPKTTLIFLDEIQAAPQVIPVLRYFYEERPELCVVAAGSLLEFAFHDRTFSMPVGRVEYLHLGPMTFEEFLAAQGEARLQKFLATFLLNDTIPQPIHQRLMDLLRTYCMTGGMPEAVQAYLQHSWEGCEIVKQSILAAYEDDFSKYRGRVPDARIRKVFRAMPRVIGEKLKYVHIDPLERAKDISSALDLLCMARVGYRVYHSAANGVPLGAELNEKFFKLLFLDVGLASAICGLNRLHVETAELTLVNEGKLAEQLIGQHLLYESPPYQTPELYYWAREQKNAAAEVDYVVSHGPRVIPVEVKAGKSGSLRSLHLFLREKQCTVGVRFNSEPPSVLKENASTLISLPLYLVGQWRRLVERV